MTWMGYTLAQWALFFFIYSFLGWIWESGYVSFREHRWVNRGFLNGPFLPIYGFGAVSILMFTLPVTQSSVLVFLMGMSGATLLEYITGYAMETLFHVKYWDYSNYRWNLNGYICLLASLCWGTFSLLMIRVIHPFISGWVLSLPTATATLAALALLTLFLADTLISLREALDMRSLLKSLNASKLRIARLQKRYEVQAAFAPNDLTRGLEKLHQSGESIRETLSTRLQALREQRKWLLHALDEKVRRSADEDAHIASQLVQNEFDAMAARTDRMYRRTARHLRRNPSVNSNRYADALQDVEFLLHP